MNAKLAASYAHCQNLARRAASNFYYCFHLLPTDKRRAMCALYAFLRITDDVSDNAQPLAERRAALAAWRGELALALEGQGSDPVLPALVDTVRRYKIPPQYLTDVLDGVEMDLEERRYATFAELEAYCYRVASVVGLSCIHIWGFRDEAALEPATRCGLAFQLTNILRDLDEDAAAGRVYLPCEDLVACGLTREDLLARVHDERFHALVALELDRAEELFRQGAALHNYLHADGRRVFGAMVATYYALLQEIRRREGDVYSRRIRVSRWKKFLIAARWTLGRPPRVALNAPRPRSVDGAPRS